MASLTNEMAADRRTANRQARSPFLGVLAGVVQGLFRVYLLEVTRKLAFAMIEGGLERLLRTKQDEKEDMSAIINREDISHRLAGIGHNSRMAALKVRHVFRSAMKDIKKSTGEHSHELSEATKDSLEGVGRYVRKNPLQSLLISLGIGVCVGVFVRR